MIIKERSILMKNHFEVVKILQTYSLIKIIKAFVLEIRRWGRIMLLGSYSQYGEDLIVEKYLKKKGKYLEIGAYHPTRLSNTYRFYKKGWRGVVVEPNPDIKESFANVRPKDTFLNVGISADGGLLNYYKFLIPAINTFSKEEAEKNINQGHKLQKIVKVKTIKVSDLVKTDIDFLSLDTEGFDEKILDNWPWDVCQPKLICTEANISLKGYKQVYRNKYNFIYLWQK